MLLTRVNAGDGAHHGAHSCWPNELFDDSLTDWHVANGEGRDDVVWKGLYVQAAGGRQ